MPSLSTALARALTVTAATVALAGVTALPAAPPAAAAPLPPGVIQLGDGEPCPPGTLCLYRDYGFSGPAYGIGAGYAIDLRWLPMPGHGGPTAADNVSSWVNRTAGVAVLIDEQSGRTRPLFPGQHLEEPVLLNDTVDRVVW
ncbi:peptidase inhibitor family I36 protein [Nonomuraea sp. NPDC048882]|uniref:peptidase inhibitor family I36 protein n=1 Tax=unclassified Nonomuraea TaxID=2593643 RepID=UPI0033CD4216